MTANARRASQQSALESNSQIIFCRDCVVLNLRACQGKVEKMLIPNPAITYQVVLENNLPVAVPVCLEHIYWELPRALQAVPDGS